MFARHLALATLLGLTAVACSTSSPSSDSPAETCESNPETPVATGGIGTRDVHAQGVRLNRIALNRISLNRISLNRISLNRIALNRIALNRISLNRISLNRIALNGISLDGTHVKGIVGASNELVGQTSEGQEVRGEVFVGGKVVGILSDGSAIDLEITKFERTEDPAIVHYALSFQGANICESGTGMFVPGVWDETGTYKATDGDGLTASYSCVDGVIGKCATWGYAAWKVGSELHAACTRMGTADYCGHGVSFTKDGTEIDMFDARGIQQAANEPGFAFEAGWGPSGAVCVSRPRYDATSTSGKTMLPSCWATLPSCDSWSVAEAKGATIGNASKPQSRTFCD